jgi:hypothetical protein
MTDRIPLDHLTSNQYDQLCDELDRAEAELRRYTEAESADAAAGSYAGRAETAEAAITRVRTYLDGRDFAVTPDSILKLLDQPPTATQATDQPKEN